MNRSAVTLCFLLACRLSALDYPRRYTAQESLRIIPKYLLNDQRVAEYRSIPIDSALERVLGVWNVAKSLLLGPGPFGMTEIPIESQLPDWLAYEHPESESFLHGHLFQSNIIVRGYCTHTLIGMGSRLLIDTPDTILKCATPVTRCLGCSVVTVPFNDVFADEIKSNNRMFDDDNSGKMSGWWLQDDDIL